MLGTLRLAWLFADRIHVAMITLWLPREKEDGVPQRSKLVARVVWCSFDLAPNNLIAKRESNIVCQANCNALGNHH